MPRFFVNSNEILKDKIILTDENYNHLSKSLRAKQGDEIEVCDGNGTDYFCEILSFSEFDVTLKILEVKPTKGEPKTKIVLYQALPKSDKLEFIIQKATELGIYEIQTVNTKFCVAKGEPKSFQKKLSRFDKIALEAAKQSGRGIIPKVNNIIDFKTAVTQLKEYDISVVCYEHGGEKIKDIIEPSAKSIGIFIGSEGGFSEDEINILKENGIIPITLGDLILRCETAPITALSLVRAALGDM